MQAMGLGWSADPRTPYDPARAALGTSQITTTTADRALGLVPPSTSTGFVPMELRAPPVQVAAPEAPAPEAPARLGPLDIFYSPMLGRYSVGGVEFGEEEYDVALQSPEFLNQQGGPQTAAPDWRRLRPDQYGRYLSSISEGRGFAGNIGVGLQNVGEGLVGGVGRGLQMLGAEEAGQALVGLGEAIGLSPAEEARSAAISGQQGLPGKIGTATIQSAPTLATAIGAGLAGAAVGGPVGALAGVALSILPMELQSSWEAAEANPDLDVTDSGVQGEILAAALGKTAAQTFGAAWLARGLSPAFRQVLGDVAGKSLGSRITRGVGAGAVEGLAETTAVVVDRVAFDPELRALMTEGDWMAIAPAFARKYGEEALISFGAGFLLGGPLGAIASPEVQTDTPPPPPRRDVDSGQPVDALNGATLDPQATPEQLGLFEELPAQAAPRTEYAGPAPQPAASAETQLELPLGPEQLGLFVPTVQPAPTTEYAGPPRPAPTAAETQPELPLPLQLLPEQRVVPMPLLPQQRAEPGQGEMFTPAEAGVPVATQARLTGQRLAGAPRPEVAAPPEATQAELEAAGQRRMELTTQPTAIASQLGPILEARRAAQNRLRQQAEEAAATRARREAEFEAAQRQAEQQREAERQQLIDAEVAWEQLRPEGSRVTFDRLTPTAQQQWSEAVSDGTADQALFDDLRRRVRPGRAQPLMEAPTIIEPEAAPEPEPTPPTPPKGGKLRRRKKDAVQEQGAKARTLRQGPKAGKGVRGEDTQGQEAAGSRVEEAQEVATEVAPEPEVQVVEGRGGRRELEPVTSAEPEAAVEPTPTAGTEAVARAEEGPAAADEAAFLEDAITEVETATTDKAFVENMTDVFFWAKNGTKAMKQRADTFIAAMEADPAVATQVRAAKDLYRAQRKDASVKPEDVLGADMDTQIVVQTLEDLNAGKLRDVTPMIRSKLRDAWNNIKGTNPQYAGETLGSFIDENSPGFFVRGPRNADGIRPVVSKATGRTKLSSYNVITNPIPMGKAKLVTSNFLARLATKPKVRVYRNIEELQRKAPELFAEADAARPQGDFATVQASGYSFGDGNVLIFTDNIVDEAHLKAVLAHETMGHFGMRGLLPQAQFNSLMDAVYDTSEVVRSAADAAVAARGLSKAEAVEEYLADFAAVLDTSLIARIWNTLKNALNKLGVKFGDDAARYLVTQARRYVRNGETSGVFDNAAIAQRLHSIESGMDPDGTGRFAPANTLSGMGIIAGNLDGSTLPYTKEGLISNFRNIADTWDRLKADVFSLTNYRAKQNPGLKKFYELVLGANRLSMRYKNEANEAMAMYLNPSLNLGVTRLGDGVTRSQKETVDSMIYAAQRYAVSKFDIKPDARRPGLIQLVDGEPTVNKARLEELRKQGRRTVKEFRDGFAYTVYDDVPMTDAKRAELRTRRDNESAQAKTDAERKAIETDYKVQIDAETFLQPREERFPGVPNLTADSIEWKSYVAAREQVERMEVELLKAHYTAHLKTVDNQLYEIDEAMGNRMTALDRQFLLRMNEKYRDLYTNNLTISEDGQVVIDAQSMKDADDFLVAVNAALIATKGSDRNAAVLTYFDQADHDDLTTRIEDFKTRFSPRTDQEKFVVQNKVKEIAVDEISRNDNGFFTERTIATGYTPVLREGRFQVRMTAVDPDTGRILKMKDTFQQQLSYHQIASVGEAAVLRDRVNELFDGTTHDVAVWDSADRVYKVKKVKLVAKAEQAVDAISAPPQLNLNEFIIGLRRFSINLDPRKMEEVVVTLTRQNSRARNRLQRTFQPGADTDAAKAISGHIESRASTIAKTVVRPDLDRLMNMNLDQTRKLWNADDTAKLDRLKSAYEAALADPNATAAVRVAAVAYDEYVYQRKNTLREDKDGVGMSQRYYSEAAKALAFMESQKNLDESDFGSGDVASQVRAATSMMQLGASPATAALNLISLGTNTLPYLATYNPSTAFGGGFGFGPAQAAMFKALRQVGAPGTLDAEKNTATYYRSLAQDEQALRKAGLTSDEALFLAREIEEGVAIPALSNSLISSARGRMTSAASQKFIDGWMVFFNRTEQSARRATLLAAYRLQYDRGIQAGKEPEIAMREAREFAVKTAEDTLGEYSVMNRPALWRGGPQQFLYMYKIFPTMSVQLLRNLPRKGQLMMLGGLIALSGLSGLPFAEDLEDLADTVAARLGLKTPSLRLEIARAIDSIMPGMSPLLMNGLVNAIVPGDVGGRTSLGDLFPGTSIFLPGADVGRELLSIAGPVAGAAQGLLSTVSGAGQWAAYTAGLSDRPASLEGLARNAPVTMVRAWADALAYVESGGVVDRRGYIVSDELSAMEVIARALGFYPTAAAEQYGLIRVSQRVSNYQRDMAAAFYNAYVQARLRGDTAQANQVVREVREWNREARGTGLEISNFQQNALRRLRDARRTATERTTRYAPKTTREQYQQAIELLGY